MLNNKSTRKSRKKTLKKTISNQTSLRQMEKIHYSQEVGTRKRQSVQESFVKIFNDILNNDDEDLLSDIDFWD